MQPLITPSLDEFLHLAKQGNVIPVSAEFVGDCETPVSAFKKFSHYAYSFLFESTEKNDVSGRFSFVGFDPRITIQSYGREIQIVRNGVEERFGTATDPLDELRKLMARYQFVARPELPRFAGGAVGFLGYEAIGFFEPKVPAAREDDLQLPEMLFMLTGNVLIFDHRLRSLKIVVNAFLDGGSPEKVYARAVESVQSITQQMADPIDLPLVPIVEDEKQPPPRSNLLREEFERAVEQAKEYIRAGDIFQVVLSQRFESQFDGEPLDFYRCLRFINPSPYMFCLKFGTGRVRPTGGFGDDARAGLKIYLSIFQDRTAQPDAGIDIAVESKITDRACITATSGPFQFGDDLHGADFWRTGDGTGGKCRSNNVERCAPGAGTANYIGNDVHHVAVTLDLHEFRHANGAEFGNPADIIPREIDKHDVFGAFLRIGQKLSAVSFILRRRHAASAGPCNRPDLDDVAHETHVHLRRTANKRKIIAELETKHVRRRIDETKTAIKIERRSIKRRFESL